MLRDFVQTSLDAEAIGDLLTMAGFELEGIEVVEGEPVLDIKVVSNRGDGLSVFGLSREVLAKDLDAHPTGRYHASASRFAGEDVETTLTLPEETVAIVSPTCHRFAVRAFDGVPAGAQAPEWMQARLRQAGMRPISLLVDLTNYVMLEQGQPLHAFDRDRLAGGRLVVREAKPGEKLTTLNGEEHELSGQMMVCDAERPVGVPGVMGGLETEVTDATERILLESANFHNTTVRKTRRELGLNTEASYRFERSVDPEGVPAALRRFTQLLLESAPEAKVSNIVDAYPLPPTLNPIRLRPARASALLGMEIGAEAAENYLARLGMHVRSVDVETLEVVPPSWRPDLVREEDLVEELGRVHGYEKIPDLPPMGTTLAGGVHGRYLLADRLRDAALRAGFTEIVSHTLRDASPLDRSADARIGPRVPASPEHAILRDSILPSLADAAARNGGRDLHLFELGRVFSSGDGYVERTHLALLSTGAFVAFDRVGRPSPTADFFSLKAVIEGILSSAGIRATFAANTSDPRFHPTRVADLQAEGRTIGILGQVEPSIAGELRLPAETILAELDFDALAELRSEELELRPVSRNPAVRRDVTVAVGTDVPYERLATAIREAAGDVLERLWLADIYRGPGLAEGQHAVTLGMQFRKVGENFTDEEANQVRDRAVAALVPLGATMR
jgi:phenylalanyl-tRNA synthetase beta chain